MSLVARHLEANGLPTLVIGSALDIVRAVKPPRYLHTDFPLGNPCGKPYDRAMQRSIISQALAFFTEASASNSIARAPYSWEDNERYVGSQFEPLDRQNDELSWRDRYSRVDRSNSALLAERGAARRDLQAEAKRKGSERSVMIDEPTEKN